MTAWLNTAFSSISTHTTYETDNNNSTKSKINAPLTAVNSEQLAYTTRTSTNSDRYETRTHLVFHHRVPQSSKLYQLKETRSHHLSQKHTFLTHGNITSNLESNGDRKKKINIYKTCLCLPSATPKQPPAKNKGHPSLLHHLLYLS